MALQNQGPTFSFNGGGADHRNEDKVHITLISSSATKNRVQLSRSKFPMLRSSLTWECIRENLIKARLEGMSDIPPTFFNGHDCDMIQKLSRMLNYSIIQSHGVHTDYICVFIMVFEDSCWYNVVNSSCFFRVDEQLPSCEFVRSLACESGAYSLPPGAKAIERLKAQDDIEDNCAICLQGFPYDSEVAKLPCSHVYHFVLMSTTAIVFWNGLLRALHALCVGSHVVIEQCKTENGNVNKYM